MKKASSNCSEIRVRPSIDSGSTARRAMLRMCRSLRPNLGAVSRWPSRTRRDFGSVCSVSFHAMISRVTVRSPLNAGIESNNENVHRYLLSSIRPPRSIYPPDAEPDPSRLPPILSSSSRMAIFGPGRPPSRIMKAAAANEAMPPPTSQTLDVILSMVRRHRLAGIDEWGACCRYGFEFRRGIVVVYRPTGPAGGREEKFADRHLVSGPEI